MPQPVIHFAHANGFPSGSYSALFSLLDPEYRVIHVDMFAHDPKYPVRDGWEDQADQLVEFLQENATGPVIGAGHSFGASVTFMAAVKRPDLFHGIILIEPILFLGWMRHVVYMAKMLGLYGYLSPANKTRGRRRHWPDRSTAEEYFKSRGLFRNFDPECLHDYIEFGTEKDDTGYHLRFSVEREVAVYLNDPHDLNRYNGRLKQMPGFVLAGKYSDAVPQRIIRKFARQQHFRFSLVDGGHMFPLEQPRLTAGLIGSCAADIMSAIH